LQFFFNLSIISVLPLCSSGLLYLQAAVVYDAKSIHKEIVMKKGIHPEFVECHVSCACGNSFTVLSNKPEMRIDICNACHPFFTGSEKIVDATGRVEKFKNKYKLGK